MLNNNSLGAGWVGAALGARTGSWPTGEGVTPVGALAIRELNQARPLRQPPHPLSTTPWISASGMRAMARPSIPLKRARNSKPLTCLSPRTNDLRSSPFCTRSRRRASLTSCAKRHSLSLKMGFVRQQSFRLSLTARTGRQSKAAFLTRGAGRV